MCMYVVPLFLKERIVIIVSCRYVYNIYVYLYIAREEGKHLRLMKAAVARPGQATCRNQSASGFGWGSAQITRKRHGAIQGLSQRETKCIKSKTLLQWDPSLLLPMVLSLLLVYFAESVRLYFPYRARVFKGTPKRKTISIICQFPFQNS